MKKWITLGITVLLVLMLSLAVADDTITFEPTYTNLAEFSATKWFGSSDMRALLTIMLALDYAQEVDDFDFAEALTNATYVAYDRDNRGLLVSYLLNDKIYSVMYVPSIETAVYGEPVDGSELTIELSLDKLDYDYHRNSSAKILEIAEMIGEAIKEL